MYEMILKKDVIKKLSDNLMLPFLGIEQDWDIEMADSKRVDEFIEFYQSKDLSSDERIALLSLIIASYNDFLDKKNLTVDNRWNKIRKILEFEKTILNEVIDYWSLKNESNDIFRITPLIRNL